MPLALERPQPAIAGRNSFPRIVLSRCNRKGRSWAAPLLQQCISLLEGGLDLESPVFQQGLRNVLRVLVPPGPFPQTRRSQVLVGGELVFANHLFEFSYSGGDRPNGFRLTPVWVSASLCHEDYASYSWDKFDRLKSYALNLRFTGS